MIHKPKSLSQKGFTIIEVLIVLAIAGLIMLIVFLAVPALNRNSHNNQYRNEANQLLAAAAEFSNNSNGAVPGAGDSAVIVGLTKNKNLTSLTVEDASSTAEIAATDLRSAILRTGSKCSGTGTQAGSPRGYALLYRVETGSGGTAPVCQES